MFNLKHFAIAGLIALFVLYVPQAIAMDPPSSLAIDAAPANYHTDITQVCNVSQGLSDSEAKKIELNYWCNSISDCWRNTNEMRNSECGNSSDRSDDYHLCHVYSSGANAAINAFDIDLPIEVLDKTGEKLMVSEIAGSSYGENPWTRFTNKTYNNSNLFISGTTQRLAASVSDKVNNIGEEQEGTDVQP